MEGLTLRFIDPKREEGFILSHGPRLSNCMRQGMAVCAILGSFLILTHHRPWDGVQYTKAEAQELSTWHMFIHIGMGTFLIITLGLGRLMARYGILNTLGLEILVVSAHCCFISGVAISQKHYLARAFGHDDTEMLWSVELGGTDGSVVLWIDVIVTGLHIWYPIRWLVLVPLEVLAIVAYAVPALLLGSPTPSIVLPNIIGLLSLSVLASIGKRAFERQERSMFAGLLAEKQMRFQAEFQLSRVNNCGRATVERDRDLRSDPSAACSIPGTTASAYAFENIENMSLDQIESIGLREQWLIARDEVELLSDSVLGRGGFGCVSAGMYQSTLVAVKAPREGITRNGLPELCNELRILRHLRHPNIAFLYGACVDANFKKLCLVLEFIDGLPLGSFVRGRPLAPPSREDWPCPSSQSEAVPPGSVSERALIISDILGALRYLHSRQPVVVHGDLKDSNVFVEDRRGRLGQRSRRAKLLDFGLSRILSQSARPLGGTARWMAPELCARTTVPPDASADCYSFGLLAYLVVAERLPFEGRHSDQVLKRLRAGQPPALFWRGRACDLEQACRPVVEQCTRAKPALRPTVRQIGDQLAALLGQVAAGATRSAADALGGRRGPAAVGCSVGSGNSSPVEFDGLVEVRQVCGASVGSLVARDLPPVQEHEVLASDSSATATPTRSAVENRHDGAQAGGCGAQAGANGSPPKRVAHPEYRPTPSNTQILALADMLLRWNAPAPEGTCCWFHGSLGALDRARGELGRMACRRRQADMFCGQCHACGLLLLQGCDWCEFCEGPGSVASSTNTSGLSEDPGAARIATDDLGSERTFNI